MTKVATLDFVREKIASDPALAEELVTFVDHWGMDHYDPPESTISAVRQIVLIACGDARSQQEPAKRLVTDSVEDFLAGRYRIE